MAETKPRSRAAAIRPIVLLLVIAALSFFGWRYAHRKEGYRGGDVVTTGTVDAVHVDLSFKVAGRLAEVPVTEGVTVQPGQLIGRLDTEDLDGQVWTAKAMVESGRAAIAQARATREKAGRDLARQRELMASDATTQQQLDAAQSAARVAAAQVEAATAQLHQAESELHHAELQRSYAELRAPEGGQVSQKVHEAGEMVMAGAPVVTLAQVDTVKVRAPVDETRIGAVRPGDKVKVKVYTFDHAAFDGEVISIQPAGDFATRKDWGAQRRDIRTFTVIAQIPNPEHLLKDGMTAEITIQVGAQARQLGAVPR